jgi:hypothetical protein
VLKGKYCSKVRLFLCLIKEHVMEIWRVEVLNLSTREEANHQLHTLAALSFIPGELTSHTYCIGDCVGPRAILDTEEDRNI